MTQANDYTSFDELEDLNERDYEPEDDVKFRIKAPELRQLLRLQDLDDEDLEGDTMADVVEETLVDCVLQPQVNSAEDAQNLGRFAMPLFNEIVAMGTENMDVPDVSELDEEDLENL